MYPPIRVDFDQGTLVIKLEELPEKFKNKKALLPSLFPSYIKWDPRVKVVRCLGAFYRDLKRYFESQGFLMNSPFDPFPSLKTSEAGDQFLIQYALRPYQEEALEQWRREKGRGLIILPTGSGKTRLAVEAIARVKKSCLVIVPTLELLAQWYGSLTKVFEGEIGRLGGGEHDVSSLTVTTYDSAYRWIDRYGDRFGLIVFDEVHHLAASTYLQIAQMAVAPYRLGLTATLERSDFRHVVLKEWVGDVVYRRTIAQISGDALASYKIESHRVFLNTREKEAFEKEKKVYQEYLRDNGLRGRKAFPELIERSPLDLKARSALWAFQAARKILMNAQAKVKKLEELLEKFPKQKFLIFTEYNDLVYQISKLYFLPAITHLTSPKERKWILEAFRQGKVRAIVTSKVLNEGVDVPEANIAVILGGSGSKREHVQRLGRILRPSHQKEALFIEILTKEERSISYRRRNDSVFKRKEPPLQRELFSYAPK